MIFTPPTYLRVRATFLSVISMDDSRRLDSNTLHLFGITISTDLKWIDCFESIATSTANKFELFCRAINFSRLMSLIHIRKSSIRLCLECSCHIMFVTSAVYLEIIDKIWKVIDPDQESPSDFPPTFSISLFIALASI